VSSVARTADNGATLGRGRCGELRLCAIAVVITLTSATSAIATKPTRESMPLPDTIVVEGVCPDLTIVANILVNREYGITFSDVNGDPTRTLTQGSLVVRLTNPDNGVSIVRNISVRERPCGMQTAPTR
jgi:hypothetical protein